MGTDSKIEWTDHTWNPWQGCTKVSAGCDNCYMYREKHRWGQNPREVIRSSRQTFRAPLKKRWSDGVPSMGLRDHEKTWAWPDGDKVFVNSWSDYFHPKADQWRPEAWNVIKSRPGLIFIIVTKRTELIPDRLPSDWGNGYPNVWLVATIESNEYINRIDDLLKVQAVVRGISVEPMLGPVEIKRYLKCEACNGTGYYGDMGPGMKGNCEYQPCDYRHRFLDWVICGGETGPGARPMHPDWARDLRDQCRRAGVPFFLKQMTKKAPIPDDLLIREFPK